MDGMERHMDFEGPTTKVQDVQGVRSDLEKKLRNYFYLKYI